MSGLTGLKVYVADFFDEKGEHAGSKIISYGFRTCKKKTFEWNKGLYNVNVVASRRSTTPFPYLIDYFHFAYHTNCPDPILITPYVHPLINPKDYNTIFKSNALEKLNKVRSNVLGDLFTFRNIMIFLIIAGAIYYFASGGSLMGGSSGEVANATVNATKTVVTGGRG